MKLHPIIIVAFCLGCFTGCIMETGDYDEIDADSELLYENESEDVELACPQNDDGSCMVQQDGTDCLLPASLADVVTAANREGMANGRKRPPLGGKITLTGRVHRRDLVPQVCHPGRDFVAMENPQHAHIEVIPSNLVETVHLSVQVDKDAAKIMIYDEYMDLVTWQKAEKCGAIEEYQDPMHAGDRICIFELPVAMYVLEFSAVTGLNKPDDLFVDFDRLDSTKGSAFVYGCYEARCSNRELKDKGVVTSE